MSFKKNFMICALLVVMLMCCVSAVSAEDSSNITLASDDIEDIGSCGEDIVASESTSDIGIDDEISSESNDVLGDGETTIYVDSNYEGEEEQGTQLYPYKTISNAVNNATGDKSTIYIRNGNYTEDSISIPENKGFSFVGESESGVVINSFGAHQSYFLKTTLNGVDLSLINLTIKNNYRSQGLIISGDGNLNIINCTWDGFMGGTSAVSGTFIFSNNNSLMKNCKFINSDSVGGTYGFIRYESGNHILDNILINNSYITRISSVTLSFSEGFIRVDSDAIVEANKLTFTNTNAAMNKGLMQVSGNFKIKNSKFINNIIRNGTSTMTSKCDGLFYVNGGNLTIENSLISNNKGFNHLIYGNGVTSIANFNYNSIIDNDYNVDLIKFDGIINASYNWWGANDISNDKINDWVLMSASIIKNNSNFDVKVLFDKYTNDGVLISDLDKPIADDFEIKFISSKSTLNEVQHVKDGSASASFTPVEGDLFVYASSSSCKLSIPVDKLYVDGNFEGEELGTIDNPFKTISNAISASNGWETIFVKNGNYQVNNIVLVNSLNLIGESQDGVIITGNNGIFSTPSFMSNNITLLFTNLTFKDAVSSGRNSIFNIKDCVSELNINDCKFDNCSSQFSLISIEGNGNYNIKNTIINNTVSDSEIQGIILLNKGNLDLDNVIISNTNCLAVSIIKINGTANIKNTRILNNSLHKSESKNSIFYLTDANLMVDSSFINENTNDYLIYNEGNSIYSLNYNSIIGNNFDQLDYGDGNYNFDYNWWGTNDKPSYDNVSNWVIMESSVAFDNDIRLIDINFNHYTDGNNVFVLKNAMNGILVNLESSKGTINNTYLTENGTISISFIPCEGENYINIISGFINMSLSLNHKILYVNSSYDGEELGTIDNPFKTISNAILNVEHGETIFVANGEYSEKISLSSDKSVSIIGESKEGVIINLKGTITVNLNGIILKFNNLTFKNNGANVAFTISGTGNLNLINCYFSNFGLVKDKAVRGATLEISNDNSLIENCTIYKSTIPTRMARAAGAIMYGGSGNHIIRDTIIESTTQQKTTTKYREYGVIYVSSKNCIVEADNLTIKDSSGQSDSLIYNMGVFNIKNSYFVNNIILSSTNKDGGKGVIYNDGGQVTIESSIISDNSGTASFGGLKYLIYTTGTADAISNVSYSKIYNNSYQTGVSYGNNELNYNWWGTNNPDVDADTWVIVDAYYNSDIVVGENATVVVSFNHYITKDGKIGELTQCVLEDSEVIFTLADGTILNKTTVNGETSITYAVNQNENITIQAYGFEFALPITVKTLRIDLVDNYTATEDANITILAPGINATVDLIIDGKKESIQIVDGKAVKTIENIQAGKHSVIVIYNNNGNIDFDSKSFTVDKVQTQISLDDINVNVGETVPLEFTIASDATGKVFIIINGKKSFEYLKDGSLSINIDLSIGNYTVTFAYEGDEKYMGSEKSIKVTVNGLDVNLKAKASDIKVGENAVIEIEINENATGATNVILGDSVIPVTFTNGKATVSIADLANGTYTAFIKFAGDDKFLADEINVTFTVTKEEIPSNINVSMDIPEGTVAPEFTVNLPSDAIGNFTVTVDGNNYTAPLVNGSATVKVPELTPGNHTISSSYSGDKKYDGFTSAAQTVEIPKASIPGGEDALNMTTPSDSANPSFSINLPKDATGNLTVTVDGKDTYTQALVNGSATVDVPKLSEGKHNITVTYTGDDKYASISKTTSVNVPAKSTPKKPVVKKQATKITAKKKTFKASKKVKKYTITLKAGKKPVKKVTVTIKVGKKTYKAKTNAKGKATFKLKKLTKKGKYKAVIKFKGYKNYKASSKKVRITVKK